MIPNFKTITPDQLLRYAHFGLSTHLAATLDKAAKHPTPRNIRPRQIMLSRLKELQDTILAGEKYNTEPNTPYNHEYEEIENPEKDFDAKELEPNINWVESIENPEYDLTLEEENEPEIYRRLYDPDNPIHKAEMARSLNASEDSLLGNINFEYENLI